MKIKAGTYHLVAGNQLSCKSGEYCITRNNGEVGFMTTTTGGFDFVPDENGFFVFPEEATVNKKDSPGFTIEAGTAFYTFIYVE